MASLAWLLIPVAAAVVAGVWGSWAGRRRSSVPDVDGVEGYERFRAAMERPRPDSGSGDDEHRAERRSERAPALAPDGPARTAD